MKTYSTEDATPTKGPRDPEFQVALKKLREINSRLGELSTIAIQSAEKIVGAMPEVASNQIPKLDEVPRGYIAELSKSLDDTAANVERIYRNVTRVANEF